MIDGTPPWVIVITKPSQEEVAERAFRQAGYRVYLPRYRREVYPHGHSRKGRPSLSPLFTGYVFVHDWHGWPTEPILGTAGLMKVANVNVTLQDGDLGLIWEREKRGAFDLLPPPNARVRNLNIGESVEMDVHGERIIGVLEALSDSGKAIVRSLMMFNREAKYTIPAEQLRRISS